MLSSNIKTYNDLFSHITTSYKNQNFLNYIKNEKYNNISIIEFKKAVLCLSMALKELGVQEKQSVAIFVSSSPFWLIFDFAIHQLGAISVPIFANISKKNLNYELEDAKVEYIFIDNEQRVKEIQKDLVFITHSFTKDKRNFFNYEELINIFQNTSTSEGVKESDEYKAKEDDVFSIIYTSGNTGTPKGVMLSHKNILSQIRNIDILINLKQDETIFSLLPLAHIFERTLMSYYLSKGLSIYFADDIKNIANLLKVVKPTMLSAVPRLLEKIFSKIKDNISKKPFLQRLIASFAFSYALKYDINKNSYIYKFFNKLVYSKLRDIFGSNLTKLVSGGAVLNKDICNFFVNIGINIYQGYGLSEFSPVVSSNYPNNNKIGSCGKVFKDTKIKFVNNEILVKGDSLMLGYLNQADLTKKTIIDGWLHTGDMGHMDKYGYLFVTNRVKEIFKTSTGEYVNAVYLEQELSKNKYIEFAVVLANEKQYVSALLFIEQEKYLLKNEQIILQSINKDIKKLNKNVNTWEKVVKYKLITKEISIESGELTPSMKICRNKIEQLYENEINTMY